MGYDLHITRAETWTDSESQPITRDEWEAYVSGDAQIQRDQNNGPNDFLYVAHPDRPIPLWWSNGEIYTKNPDELTIDKLCQIAKSLGASVFGDDDETYPLES